VPRLAETHIPVDLRATKTASKAVPVLLDSRRFPSDPPEMILESNDVAVLLRSDHLDHIAAGSKAIFQDADLFEMTSIRKGFAGGGFDGGQSLPKKMAVAAQVPGSFLIPDSSELFLGFTSTQKAGLGPPRSQPRGARLQPRRVLRRRYAPRDLAHLGGPRGLVRELSARRARLHRLPARPERAG
jgi:hypothetical protein